MTSKLSVAPLSRCWPRMAGSRFAPAVSMLCSISVFSCGRSREERGERAVAQEIRDFVKVADGMQALEREIVAVVGRLARALGPAAERGAQRVADFLLLLVEHLLRHFLPREAQVARGRAPCAGRRCVPRLRMSGPS